MRLLLDTHIALWLLEDHPALTDETRTAIQTANDVFVSAASLWEIVIKQNLGKLQIDLPLPRLADTFLECGYSLLSVSAAHALQVGQLPPFHRDPFDRMLIAQSIHEPLRLLTNDKTLARYGSSVWVV